MLPEHYRYQAKNDTGATIDTLEIKRQGVGVSSSDLSVTYGSWSSDIGTTSMGDGTTFETADVDNSTNGFHADNLEVVVTISGGSPDGNVTVYFQPRGDGSSDWPEDETGWAVAVLDISATGTFRAVVQV